MVRKNGLLLGLFMALTLSFSSLAQINQPIKVWDFRYGGNSRDTDVNSIKTSDGGFLLTASSLSPISGNKAVGTSGNDDWWLVRLTSAGDVLWQLSIGGSLEEGFEGGAIETSDGDFVLAGRTRSGISGDLTSAHRGRNDILVVKIHGDGSGILWQTRLGGNKEDVAYDIIETSDGAVVVGGYTTSTDIENNPNMGSLDAYLAKLDQYGNLLWERTFGGSGFESADQLLPDSEGGVTIGGYSASTDLSTPNKGSFDFWLFNVDDQGNQLWENTYGGNGLDAVRAFVGTNDGGYLMGGQSSSGISGDKTEPNQGADDIWLVKTDDQGNLLWEKNFGGNGYDWCESIYALTDDTFVIGGFSNSDAVGDKNSNAINGSLDAWFLKIRSNGDQQWQGLFGGPSDEANVNIPFYDEINQEMYLSGTTNSGLGAFLSTENFGSQGDIWFSKFRVNTLPEMVRGCNAGEAIVTVEHTIETATYELRETDGSALSTPVSGNGSDIQLIAGPIEQVQLLDVYAYRSLTDGSILEEYLGQVAIEPDNSLEGALSTAINFRSDICYNRSSKVWISQSEQGLIYELLNNEGNVVAERTGNGNKIHLKTPRLKESSAFSLRISNETCSALHSENIAINVSDRLRFKIQVEQNDDELTFSTEDSGDIVDWTWIFDYRVKKKGPSVVHSFRRPGFHFIKLRVTNSSGCTKERFKRIFVKDNVFIGVPGLYKPHATHGPFKVRLKNVSREYLKIFDKYGRPVYSGKNSWNGRKKGRVVKEGVYVYYIQARRQDGTLFRKRGSFYVEH